MATLMILGLVPYEDAWELQRQLVKQCQQFPQTQDILMLLEHPPVYTLGQGADEQWLKFDQQTTDATVYRVERGGEVTYHCPGQLVGYPILHLKQRHQPDLHWYLRQLEEVLIQSLAAYDLPAHRIPGLTGVWIKGIKVAAIGIKVSRWVTMHGFALNICPDLTGFQKIVPCGLIDRPVGSLQQFIPDICFSAVQTTVANRFAKVFQLQWASPRKPTAAAKLTLASAQGRPVVSSEMFSNRELREN